MPFGGNLYKLSTIFLTINSHNLFFYGIILNKYNNKTMNTEQSTSIRPVMKGRLKVG